MKHLVCLAIVLFGVAWATVADGDRAVEQGDYETAVSEYSAAYELRNSNIDALYKLARAKTYLAETLEGDEAAALFEEAVAHARAAIEAAPDEPEAHFELARALGRLAQFRGVVASLDIAGDVKDALERTVELNPGHGGAYHALAMWNLEVPWIAGGRSAQVRPLFEQAIAAEPGTLVHHVGFAEALITLGDEAGAREQLELALRLPADTFRDDLERQKAQEILDGL